MDTHISASPEATLVLGQDLAKKLRNGDVVGLVGDLGAGKTQFVKGVAQGLGYLGRIHSPTFTLVNEYPTEQGMCYHLDLYRLENPRDILTAGLEQYLYLAKGFVLIEWFDRLMTGMPRPSRGYIVRVNTISERKRKVTIEKLS